MRRFHSRQAYELIGSFAKQARAAEKMPWEPAQLSLYRTIFPQMAEFLGAEEAKNFRRAFAEELLRLDPPKD